MSYLKAIESRDTRIKAAARAGTRAQPHVWPSMTVFLLKHGIGLAVKMYRIRLAIGRALLWFTEAVMWERVQEGARRRAARKATLDALARCSGRPLSVQDE